MSIEEHVCDDHAYVGEVECPICAEQFDSVYGDKAKSETPKLDKLMAFCVLYGDEMRASRGLSEDEFSERLKKLTEADVSGMLDDIISEAAFMIMESGLYSES